MRGGCVLSGIPSAPVCHKYAVTTLLIVLTCALPHRTDRINKAYSDGYIMGYRDPITEVQFHLAASFPPLLCTVV